jgi:hypothetical protein
MSWAGIEFGSTIERYTNKKRLELIMPEKTENRWIEDFDDEKRETMLIVAKYYITTRYFRSLSKEILENPDFIPSERAYQYFCSNKYATRVLEETRKEPNFQVSEMVYPRTTALPSVKLRLQDGGIILQPDAAPVIDAVRGAKRYLVLPVGSVHGVVVAERHLKRKKTRTRKRC